MDKEKEVLNFLFNSSKQDSNRSYDIKPIAGHDALMIASKLLKSGLIKDDIIVRFQSTAFVPSILLLSTTRSKIF